MNTIWLSPGMSLLAFSQVFKSSSFSSNFPQVFKFSIYDKLNSLMAIIKKVAVLKVKLFSKVNGTEYNFIS